MAALDFPNSPTLNDTYTANGRTFSWNGEAWVRFSSTFTNNGSFVFYDGPLNVGIGTQTPSTKFEVAGTISATDLIVNGNTVWHAGNDGPGSGLNADLLDGINGGQFLRSDTADVMSQGAVSTATLTVRNTNSSGSGTATGSIVAEFSGDSDRLVIQNINNGDYGIYNTGQNNGIEFYDSNGGVVITYDGQQRITATGIGIGLNDNVIIGSVNTPSVTLDIDGNDAVQLTVGTTAERPAGSPGMIRYNSTLGQFEGYTTEWGEISGGTEINQYVATVSGTPNEIEVSGSGGSAANVTIGLPDDVTIGNDLLVSGDLVVNGTTTTVDASTITIEDPVFTLGGGDLPTFDDGKDRGIEFNYYDTQPQIGFFGWDNSANRFIALEQATNTSEVFSGTYLDAQFGTVFAELSGNATTASALQNARNIALGGDLTGSANFDGTSNITINAVIQNDAVTWNKIENVAAGRILGRVPGSAGSVQELTPEQSRNVSISQRQVYVQNSVPSTPATGELWFDSDTGSLCLYYDDGNSQQWVAIGGSSNNGSLGSGNSPFVDTGSFVYYGGPRNVGIGTSTPSEALEVDGNILATQDVIAYSDRNLKKNIQTLSDTVNIVKQLRGVSFRRKSDMTKSIGLIAQEVQEVLPEVVKETDDGVLAIAYGNIVGLLVESTKEQQKEIESQAQQIKCLEQLVYKLVEK